MMPTSSDDASAYIACAYDAQEQHAPTTTRLHTNGATGANALTHQPTHIPNGSDPTTPPPGLTTSGRNDIHGNGGYDNTTNYTNTVLEQLFAEYVEEELLRSADLVTARFAVAAAPRVPTWQELTDEHALLRLLSVLAYNVEDADPWKILGLARLEGPRPTVSLLNSRKDVAIKLLGAIPMQRMTAQGRSSIKDVQGKLEKACEACCEDINKVLLERKLLKGQQSRIIPRWQEPSGEMMAFLTAQIPASSITKIALHVSNILDYDLSRDSCSLDVEATRQLHNQLCGPAAEIEQALTLWKGRELITWAPQDNGQFQQVATAMRALSLKGRAPSKLILAVPLEPFPGCGQISDFLDIWSHPILGARWWDILQGIVILAQPTRIVVSGLHGPMHRVKNIALFTLAPVSGGEPERQLIDWRSTIFKYDVGPVVIVDVPEAHAHQVREQLATAKVPGVLRIDAPRPSPSSMSGKRRTVIHMHVERTTATPLFLEMVLPWLRKGLRDYEALVGCTATVSSTSTLLMDVPFPSAALTHCEGWWSAIAVSPRLVLIETRCDATWWQAELTTKWRVEPARAAEKIRFRPSSQVAQQKYDICENRSDTRPN